MAHWGIAISQRANPLVGPPDAAALKRGLASIERAKAIGATQQERDYIAAIEIFYKDSDKLDHRTRVLAYEKAMEQLYLSYSQDIEAAVFYALALNEAIDYEDKTYVRQLKAAGILEKAYAKQPEHPGVLHYLIHTMISAAGGPRSCYGKALCHGRPFGASCVAHAVPRLLDGWHVAGID